MEQTATSAPGAEVAGRLARHLQCLAREIGERNVWRPAALRAAASYVCDQKTVRLRFVAFVNEEPPFFATPLQGNEVYARRARRERARRGER